MPIKCHAVATYRITVSVCCPMCGLDSDLDMDTDSSEQIFDIKCHHCDVDLTVTFPGIGG